MSKRRSTASGRKEPPGSEEDRRAESSASLRTPRKAQEDPLVGSEIVCPGHVFHTPEKSYPGVVIGVVTGAKGRREERLWVQFHEDGSEYWFPRTEVANWAADTPPRGRQVMHCALVGHCTVMMEG